MSFILDALRKVEEERKRAATPEEHSEIRGGREWGESRVLRNLSLVAVALLAIVAIALSAYNLLQSNRAPVLERTAEIAPVPATATVPPPVSSAPARPPQVVQLEFPPFKGATSAPTEAETASANTGDALKEAEPERAPPVRLVGKPKPGINARSESMGEPSAGAESPESTSEAVLASEPSAQRVGGSPQPSSPGGGAPGHARYAAPTQQEEPSAQRVGGGAPTQQKKTLEPQENPVIVEADLTGLPNLVLQGTATVEDRHVAIVNYQRVFEGDIIEGARVVKILDRAIELEFSGRRYTLRF